MEPDERVGIEPVPAGTVPPVDQGDRDVGVVDERVGERHPGRACADHDVVGIDRVAHGLTVAPPRLRVNGKDYRPTSTRRSAATDA
ncbi:hypothetical protein GCM10027448_17540 [Nocardioides dilutus]